MPKFDRRNKPKLFIESETQKICMALNYVKHLLILASAITGCVLLWVFAFFVSIPIGITSSAVGLNICVITAEIDNLKSIIKK